MNDDQLPLFSDPESLTADFEYSAEDSLKTPEWILSLLNIKGIGSRKALLLIKNFDSIQQLMSASDNSIKKIIGKTEVDFSKLERVDASQPDDVKIITYFDSLYPVGLRDLPDAPPLLWYRGIIPTNRSVAIVGTRNADEWGKRTTRLLARKCGDSGISVVSGLALGIDTEAHVGCLETITPTIAILACDVRHPTPKTNTKLSEQIIEKGGCLIAEVPPGTVTESFALVARNRLQAAWAQKLVVTQCGVPSGTLHTVKAAIELGREVISLTPPNDAVGSQYEGNWRLAERFNFDGKILGGSKKFQDSLKDRKYGADSIIGSASEIENFLRDA
jgi:DNA processing protein